MSFWAEIKQRRITQIVVTYLMGGWAALVVVDQVVDREVLPLVVYEVALTLYLIGILAALIIGWYHGERGEQKAPRGEIAMLGVVGIVALAASVVVVRSASSEASLADAIDEGDLRQIAVLYLDDMSADGSLQAVADGITEGLISTLAAVSELDVTSRNGSRQARDLGAVSPDSIAKILEVGALVDGTLDRVGDELRVSVRLLEGVTGQPLFRESYRWPVDEVASVGTELATELANALRERLGVEIRLRRGQARAPNSAAWLQVARAERYIKDAAEALQRGDPEATSRAFDAAEQELIAAQESAPEWAEPLVLRSLIAYERWVFAQDLEDFLGALGESVAHADAALYLDPDDAAALERRGTALYRRWLDGGEDDDTKEELFAGAHADLERALNLDRQRASVNSTLSHLYYQTDEWARAAIAAREAYEQDAFLDVADGVLWRLFTAYYDLGEHESAEDTCAQGKKRFPLDYRFVQCQLVVMTMPAAEPDIDRAWELHEELLPTLTDRAELYDAQSRLMIAGIIGRAGLADSANAVFEAARVGPEIDPTRELLAYEAAMRSVMGDVDGSLERLERYMVVRPEHSPGQHWWWRNVESHPDFQRFQSSH